MADESRAIARDSGRVFEAFSAAGSVSVAVAVVRNECYAVLALLATGLPSFDVGPDRIGPRDPVFDSSVIASPTPPPSSSPSANGVVALTPADPSGTPFVLSVAYRGSRPRP